MSDQAVRQIRDALAQLDGDHAREGADAQAALDALVAALSEATARAEKERVDWNVLVTDIRRDWDREVNALQGRVRKLTEALERIEAIAKSWHGDDAAKGRALAVLAGVASAERSNP